jgi:hypothetical protein
MDRELKAHTANSTYKKLAVQCFNEALCFVSSSVVADSFRLRNRQLLVAAKRCVLFSSDSDLNKLNENEKINSDNYILID